MNNTLEKLFQSLEHQRRELLHSLHNVAPQKLNRCENDKWSVNQILAHLIAAERLSVSYLKKKIQGIETASDTGFVEELKMLVLKISQRLPLKFKAPKVVVENTTTETDFEKLQEEWTTVRLELKLVLERVEDRHIKRKIYRHVRAGMLNVQHALQFLKEHVGHHTPQITNQLKQN
ncbi:MAG: DinB family protein [Bacteroidetes bacterium]|nr:DinB family protein [Bacteroidota bacterium]